MVTPKTRDLIVVGASAGGVEALRQFASGLSHDLAASILVVLHLPPGGTSALPAILRAAGPLRAVGAQHGMELEHGSIYTARPNHHLLVMDGSLALSHGPTEGRRPAINVLFRSAALAGGPRVTGVLLSGMLDDGVAGLIAIAGGGGTVMVQDPADRRSGSVEGAEVGERDRRCPRCCASRCGSPTGSGRRRWNRCRMTRFGSTSGRRSASR